MGTNLKNVRPKKIEVILDKPRHLLYDLNAFAELEDVFGSVKDAMEALESGKVKPLISLLWAGLVHEDEELTIKQVGAMISLTELKEVAEKMAEALMGALPDAEKVKGKAEAKNE